MSFFDNLGNFLNDVNKKIDTGLNNAGLGNTSQTGSFTEQDVRGMGVRGLGAINPGRNDVVDIHGGLDVQARGNFTPDMVISADGRFNKPVQNPQAGWGQPQNPQAGWGQPQNPQAQPTNEPVQTSTQNSVPNNIPDNQVPPAPMGSDGFSNQ